MVLRAPDANTEVSSSSTSDANGQDSSTEQPDANEQSKSDSSNLEQAPDSDGEETSTEATGEEEQVGDQQDSQQEQQQDESQTANVITDKPEDAQLPFHKHPRFQEVIAAKNLAMQEVEKSKPLVQQATALQDFMRTNNISTNEFQSALQYLQALRTDPVAAFKMLQPTYEQLAQFAGEVLPQDLQAKVAAATLSLEDAKEIAKARAQSNYQQVRSQWQSQAGQQSAQSIISQSIGLWENTKKGSDPDLKPGTDLYKLVDEKIRALPRFNTPEDAMQGCEKAYTDAKAFFAKYAPRQTPQRRNPLQSRNSATGNTRAFKTAEEIARFIGAGGKPDQVRYA